AALDGGRRAQAHINKRSVLSTFAGEEHMHPSRRTKSIRTKALLLGATMLTTGLAGAALAAEAPANSTVEEIVVTGYRKSLTDATNAKKDSTSFTDSVFAEDIGKFP